MNKDQIEILHKEIDLIQACINRMAQNSFLIKGWAISIMAVVLALSKDSIFSPQISIILLIVLGSFWWLDAYFLHIERLYRKLYEDVIKKRTQNNWSSLYDLNPHQFTELVKSPESVKSHWRIMFSSPLRVFYGVLTTTIILVWLFCYLVNFAIMIFFILKGSYIHQC